MKKTFALLISFIISFNISAQSPATGAVEAVFNVSDLGGATYTIPIKVPDGVCGLQPSVSIGYNSHGGNGTLGMGWSVSGVSAITRVPNNIYHDKRVSGIELNGNDRFALDGNRLILVAGGNYGGANTHYRTEMESFQEIMAIGFIGTGPLGFAVKDKDGKTYEYGTAANARATI